MTANNLYQKLILDHNREPHNFGQLQGAKVIDGFNPLCGDRYQLFLEADAKTIRKIQFTGAGCAISKASASMMTDYLKGLTISQAKKLIKKFIQMATVEGKISPELGKLQAFSEIHKYPARVKCAVLAWRTVEAALNGQVELVINDNQK